MRSAKPLWGLVVPIVSGLALLVWAAPELAAQAKGPAKPPAKEPAKQAAKAPAKTPPAAKTQQPATEPAPVAVQLGVRRRDPFEPLVSRRTGAGDAPECTGPGKAGLVVATVRLDGIVRAANGMIAVVANPQNRVYFLREGDRLCNGSVERITMESVSFRERGKDPFGNPLDRVVGKRLYPSAGEQR